MVSACNLMAVTILEGVVRGRNVLGGNCPGRFVQGELSRGNCLGGNCPGEELSEGDLFRGGFVLEPAETAGMALPQVVEG
jgi:hypothetical protein